MRVYVTRNIPAEGLRELDGYTVCSWPEADVPVPRDVLAGEIADCDGLLCQLTDQIDEDLLARAPRLRVVSNYAVGYDNIDVDACTRRRIMVTNTPGVLTDATADLAFGLLLAAARRIAEAERVLRAGQWRTWSPLFMAGQEVAGGTLGIVGLGRIGSAMARRGFGFGMRVLFSDRDETPRPGLTAERVELPDLLRQADFVSIHVPLTADTRGLIGGPELELMKPTAILINTARGGIVDEAALIRALKENRIAGAALDVMEHEPLPPDDPLLSAPNLVLTPHIGSASRQARTAMAQLAGRNLARALAGQRPEHMVNPEVWGEQG